MGNLGYPDRRPIVSRWPGVLVMGLALALLVPGIPAFAAPPTPNFSAPPDPYASHDPQTTCDPVAKPGVIDVRDMLDDLYGPRGYDTGLTGIVRDCSVGGTSEHKEGRALDYEFHASDPVQNAEAQEFLDWLLATDDAGEPHAMARRLGVMYIIWDHQIWSAARHDEGWRAHSGHPHDDHIHISFSWAGANQETTWWTDAGDPPPTGGDGTWHIRYEQAGGPADYAFTYGRAGDTMLVCDWTGDGTATPVAVRDGEWHLRDENRGGPADLRFTFGRADDDPVCGDWNGDGTDTVGVRRDGRWLLRNSNSGGNADLSFTYGRADDVPVVGDWSGDGTDTVGVRRGGRWLLRDSNSGGNADLSFTYGRADDRPLVGSWLGDGVDYPGILR